MSFTERIVKKKTQLSKSPLAWRKRCVAPIPAPNQEAGAKVIPDSLTSNTRKRYRDNLTQTPHELLSIGLHVQGSLARLYGAKISKPQYFTGGGGPSHPGNATGPMPDFTIDCCVCAAPSLTRHLEKGHRKVELVKQFTLQSQSI